MDVTDLTGPLRGLHPLGNDEWSKGYHAALCDMECASAPGPTREDYDADADGERRRDGGRLT